ncbi:MULTISPECIES: NAD-dependent epimerase/dehydratase family protein [Candidatus Ichthyocystis]|uniref:NAD-dependent epimerase/dehydratase family protein n=1 Tax=Candidatus Ichthyocystis TaxID=2929841 RepID=UPI000B85BD91|nr:MULTISPECIES: NAD(P)-dependent oxidoreductase [Ichthyocystis]
MNNDIIIVGLNQQLRTALQTASANEQRFKDIRILKWGQEQSNIETMPKATAIIKQSQPKYIIHLGLPRPLSEVGRREQVQEHYKKHIDEVEELLKIITEAPNYNPHYLYCSSVDIYNSKASINIVRENSELDKQKKESNCLISCENIIKSYSSKHNLTATIARLFESTYPNFLGKHPLQYYCSQINTIRWGIRPPEIWVGNLNSYYDFLAIEDVAIALLTLIQKKSEQVEIYNVSSGEASCLFDLVSELIKISGLTVGLHVDVLREKLEDTHNIIGDNQKITTETPWKPEQNFTSSLSYLLGENHYPSNNKRKRPAE